MRTEAELDERLQGLHYRIEHESIPLNEEKRILQQIKKLESQRAKVRCAARAVLRMWCLLPGGQGGDRTTVACHTRVRSLGKPTQFA